MSSKSRRHVHEFRLFASLPRLHFSIKEQLESMNTSIDAAQDLLLNAPEELKATLAGASDEAKAALSSVMPQGSNLNGVLASTTNGHSGEDAASRARLQVVDEVRVNPTPAFAPWKHRSDRMELL